MQTETVPPLVLAVLYWLHMLATVIWVGGLAALSLVVLPAARRALEPPAFSALLTRIQGPFQRVAWLSLGVLVVTGLFQMSANPHYSGFLAIANTWAAAILVKHLVIGLMVLVSGYATWGVLPALQRTALLHSLGKPVEVGRTERLQQREILLLRLNLGLSIVVLALTAWARSLS